MNMVTISPIYLENAEDIYESFFDPAFLQIRLGKQGLWHGRAASLLKMENPVRREDFENLLKGFIPDGTRDLMPASENPNRLAGWRVTLTLPPAMSGVWSVRSRGVRLHIERVFGKAVLRTLGHLERQLGESSNGVEQASLFAVFRTNAAQDFAPQLQATAVLFNFGIQRDGKVVTFSLERLMALESESQRLFERAISTPLAKYRYYGSVLRESLYDYVSTHFTMPPGLRRNWSGQDAKGNVVSKYPGFSRHWRSHARASWTNARFDGHLQFMKHPKTALKAKLWGSFDALFRDAPRVHGRKLPEATTPPPKPEKSYSRFADTIRISPLFRNNVADTFGPFFQRPPAQEMLAKEGRWHNDAAKLLQLKNPVEPAAFYNLVDGKAPDGSRKLVPRSGGPNPLVGWRLSFTAPQNFNWGWSVSSWTVSRRFERAFEQSVDATLRDIQRIMEGRWDTMSSRDKGCLAAVFRSNAAIDYSPQLQATVLLFNFALHPEGAFVTFAPEQLMNLERRIKTCFHDQLLRHMAKHNDLLSAPDREDAAEILKFLRPLDPNYRMSWWSREHWSGRNHEGARSKLLPACFPDWQSNTEFLADQALDTQHRPLGFPSIKAQKTRERGSEFREESLRQKQPVEASSVKEELHQHESRIRR